MEKIVEKIQSSNNRVMITQIILCICGFMFARVGIGAQYYTLGVAYLATNYKDIKIRNWTSLFILLGFVSISIFNFFAMYYLVISGFIIIFRSIMTKSGIKFRQINQTVILVASVFIVKTSALVLSGFNLIGFATVLLECLVSAMLVVLLSFGVNALLENRSYVLTQKEATSLLFMFIAILMGFIDFYIEVPIFIEIYFRDILVFIFLIAITYLGGINLAVTVSVLIGGMLTMINYIPVNFCLIYSTSVIVAGLFIPLGRIWVILGMGIGQMLGYVIFNASVIDMPLMGSYFVAAIISLLIPTRYFGLANWFSEKRIEQDEQHHMIHIQEMVINRLDHFKQAFYKLGVSFNKEQFVKSTLDKQKADNIIEETLSKLCNQCNLRTFCWEDDAVNMYKMSLDMIAIAQTQGKLLKGDIPPKFKLNCKRAESFASTLSFRLDIARQKLISENKIAETKMLMGQQMEVVANSIDNITEELTKEVVFNKEMEKTAREALESIGIKVHDLLILEKDGELKLLDIYTKYCHQKEGIDSDIIKTLNKALSLKLELKKHLCNSVGCYFSVVLQQKYGVLAGAAICAKGDISGDVYSFMQLENGKYLMAVADGMGSGELARTESKITIEMLEEFMEAGLSPEASLKLINSTLVLRQQHEVFSTVDVTIIDTSTGIAKILKAGAATTFILRGNEIFTIKSESLPVGIIKDADIEIHNIQLEYGDIIIMVTDGLLSTNTDALGREEAFKEFI
ncbi:MAG: hypothetical protein BEN19_04025 [Epulopiscium sp. Nuni2H_MBin003]|nr:MAG: hypothetical protein BEN19_04025 [Epulopiscium sp. Nuni2H_MBin003]